MRPTDRLERWKISKLVELLDEGKFVKLSHQRPLTLKRNSSKRFIDSALNNKLLQNFIFADLKSSYDSSEKDRDFFSTYIKKGKEYSIEDCQHRMATLQSISVDDFVGQFEGRIDEFYDSEVPVLVITNRTKEELIRDFGEVNSGRTVTNDNLVWGIDNVFNDFIKNRFVGDERFLRLYNTKNKSEHIKRTLYGNILKIIKVCSYHDDIIDSPSTNAESMMSFVKSNIDVQELNRVVELFVPWYEFMKPLTKSDSFTTQSNLFFIIHILTNLGEELGFDRVYDTFDKLTDTRSSAEKRYIDILKILSSEK